MSGQSRIESTQTEDLAGFRARSGVKPRAVLRVVYTPDHARIGEQFALQGDGEVIGRDTLFDGAALGDRRMSGQHARIERDRSGSWSLQDLESKNGSWVDSQRVRESSLQDGGFFQLGRTFLQACWEEPFDWRAPGSGLLGVGPAMHRLRESIRSAALHGLPVMVLGPSGAGKEPTAREIHRLSGRAGEWVPVNCGALPAELIESELFGHVAGAFTGAVKGRKGLMVAADRGTLFLDEIGELPLDLQPKLLRAIQEGAVRPVGETRELPVQVRMVAATHRDPVLLVQQGKLRHDLYARLGGAVVRVPGLAEHKEDIGVLSAAALQRAGQGELALSPELVWALLGHAWPLNVRALQHVVASAAAEAEGGQVGLTAGARLLLAEQSKLAGPAEALAGPAPEISSEGGRHRMPPREELSAVLRASAGNVSKTAKALGVHRYQVYRWLEACGLDPAAHREGGAEGSGPKPAEAPTE